MNYSANEKWALLGASSGLGAAFSTWGKENLRPEQMLISRKSPQAFDFSKEQTWPDVISLLKNYAPTRLFYFSGGGPFGPYSQKKWTSHLWAYQVNLLFPAFLLAHLSELSLRQIVFVGSSIAESQPDPGAASYASAKHGLKGLVTSIQAEKSFPALDLRLLSPGYMDTPLLPAHAWPRQMPGRVKATPEIANILGNWIQDPAGFNGHLILNPEQPMVV